MRFSVSRFLCVMCADLNKSKMVQLNYVFFYRPPPPPHPPPHPPKRTKMTVTWVM